MFYRVHQFFHAFFPFIRSSELKWVQESLSPEAYSLFLKQSRSEQRHALDVAQSIKNDKQALAHPDFQYLLIAALLHDCGKSVVPIHLWHRVFIVLMQKMPKSIWSRIETSYTVFASPLKIANQHANWGKSLAQKAGLNPRVCQLICDHHAPKTELGYILERADNMN